MEKKKILVTGGAGYIGSFTVRELLDQKYDVVVLDSLENGHKEAVDPRARLEIVDLSNKKDVERIFDKYSISAVVDFAAYLSVGESMENPKKYIKNNVENFIKLLDVMVSRKCKYIIKSSTASTYGNPIDDSAFPLNENYQESYKPKESALLRGKWYGKELEGEEFLDQIIKYYYEIIGKRPDLKLIDDDIIKLRIPTSVYGITKLLDEIILEKYNNFSDIRYVILRYFNVCGADKNGEIGEDHPDETHIIPVVIKNILTDTKFRLNGSDYPTEDGTPIRDYIHVEDLAKGHVRALAYLLETRTCNVFNLGNGKGYSVKEVIGCIEKYLGKNADYQIGPRRSGDPELLIAGSAKAEKILGWKARYNLDDIIKSAIKWHRKNPKGYES